MSQTMLDKIWKKIRNWTKPKILRNLWYLLSYNISTIFPICYVLNGVFHDFSWFFQIPSPKLFQVVLTRLRQRIHKIFVGRDQGFFEFQQIKPVLKYLNVLNYYEWGCRIFCTNFSGSFILLNNGDKWKLFQ